VGGLTVGRLTRADYAVLMVEQCLAARSASAAPKLVFTANGHTMSLAASDPAFQRLLDAADMIRADGQSVVAASKFLTRTPISERACTTDFIHDAASAAARHGLKFFLLGASEAINAKAVEALTGLYPGLEIVGRRNGYFSRGDEAAICEEISASSADVVWVGLGVPLQQDFCVRNRHRIAAGWLVTCGGCFDFLAGNYIRAPRWMQAAGLEWLHRLACDPKRLFWRYAVTNPHALYLMLTRSGEAPRRSPTQTPAATRLETKPSSS
jgi:exopolysaccharide biosynthesis WecB/TagA/CpsF family protein